MQRHQGARRALKLGGVYVHCSVVVHTVPIKEIISFLLAIVARMPILSKVPWWERLRMQH